jgi:tripartite-type tricarboxylate transporter receptor subunit TctC
MGENILAVGTQSQTRLKTAWHGGLTLAVLSAAAGTPAAQTYPSKPIRVVNTSAAGGPAELVARTLGQGLTDAWGQQVVVDTRAGAAGTIGAEIVARAAPDGYTLLLGAGSTMVIAPLVQKVSYDAIKDFAAVSMVVVSPFALAVHPSVSAKNLKEFITLAKAKPKFYNFGSAGTGSTAHLGGEQLKILAGIELQHVPYKGVVPALADLVAGQIQMLFGSTSALVPQAKAGKITLLATAGPHRSALAPDTPTVGETFPGYEVVTWYSIAAPAKTPQSLVNKLNGEIVRVLSQPDRVARLAAQGHEARPTTPEDMVAYTRSEIAKFSKLVKLAGVKASE